VAPAAPAEQLYQRAYSLPLPRAEPGRLRSSFAFNSGGGCYGKWLRVALSPARLFRSNAGASHPAKQSDLVKTARERAEEKRQEKLELVREQVESGALVIRQMTEEERRRYPPRPASPKQSGKR
jgi:hypothetical protein